MSLDSEEAMRFACISRNAVAPAPSHACLAIWNRSRSVSASALQASRPAVAGLYVPVVKTIAGIEEKHDE